MCCISVYTHLAIDMLLKSVIAAVQARSEVAGVRGLMPFLCHSVEECKMS